MLLNESEQFDIRAGSPDSGESCRNASLRNRAVKPRSSHVAASNADVLWGDDSVIVDTSPRRERRTGREWDGPRSRWFCNRLPFWELLGADTVREGNTLKSPIGSPEDSILGKLEHALAQEVGVCRCSG